MIELERLLRDTEQMRADLALFEPTGNFIEGALLPRPPKDTPS